MNKALLLRGSLESAPFKGRGGGVRLPHNALVEIKKITQLRHELEELFRYWKSNREIGGALIEVHYENVVAKSNRIRRLLKDGVNKPIDSIRGAKFGCKQGKYFHIFTHYVSLNALETSIAELVKTEEIIKSDYNGCITAQAFSDISNKSWNYDNITMTSFKEVVFDVFHVKRFTRDEENQIDISENTIITLYDVGVAPKELLRRFGLTLSDAQILDNTTLRLEPKEVEQLNERAPYLISMHVRDLALMDPVEGEPSVLENENMIPPPGDEPVVGVIDTQFNEQVYFHKWVDYHNMLSPDIELVPEDFYHGTEVSSIIVDGPKGNPKLEDGCGRFRVRHFGVATHKQFSSLAILRMIRNIVRDNQDIKVWNLSLGSRYEIKENSISLEGAELDRIQNEYDVIFIVAGTNKSVDEVDKEKRIGAPADSLNSLVVNSVTFDDKSASYTRVGPVLSFFNKPDISYYGGDNGKWENKIVVCRDDKGACYQHGTSLAAPWITRKVAYLIYVMKLSREVAKALIIDAAAGWSASSTNIKKQGYGIVPKHISDIISTETDEIRFIITGRAKEYSTHTYTLPVPVVSNKHPFIARATLVYFPACQRWQGVDYTDTEMDLHFGRVKRDKGTVKIVDIKGNKQADEGLQVIHEEDARELYRKWDNVKRVCEAKCKRLRSRNVYSENGLWGLKVIMKQRTGTATYKEGLAFGVVVTLKEIFGENRYEDFIRLCQVQGWVVQKLDSDIQWDLYMAEEENLYFE